MIKLARSGMSLLFTVLLTCFSNALFALGDTHGVFETGIIPVDEFAYKNIILTSHRNDIFFKDSYIEVQKKYRISLSEAENQQYDLVAVCDDEWVTPPPMVRAANECLVELDKNKLEAKPTYAVLQNDYGQGTKVIANFEPPAYCDDPNYDPHGQICKQRVHRFSLKVKGGAPTYQQLTLITKYPYKDFEESFRFSVGINSISRFFSGASLNRYWLTEKGAGLNIYHNSVHFDGLQRFTEEHNSINAFVQRHNEKGLNLEFTRYQPTSFQIRADGFEWFNKHGDPLSKNITTRSYPAGLCIYFSNLTGKKISCGKPVRELVISEAKLSDATLSFLTAVASFKEEDFGYMLRLYSKDAKGVALSRFFVNKMPGCSAVTEAKARSLVSADNLGSMLISSIHSVQFYQISPENVFKFLETDSPNYKASILLMNGGQKVMGFNPFGRSEGGANEILFCER